ncbi:hypothetical protein HPP92_024005 [Vanilla planifolia]|nr:hypothetical protein HPP92_024005 [Vanilla planifolia]
MGPILVYPTNRTKWDDRMIAMTPEEEVFYSVGLLLSAEKDDLVFLEKQNAEILQFCEQNGIKFKLYLPVYRRREEWKKHFGGKWKRFEEMKMKYDPKAILAPGQGIFT